MKILKMLKGKLSVINIVLALLIALGAGASCIIIDHRIIAESKNKTVAMAIDWVSLNELAQREDKTVTELLKSGFKRPGGSSEADKLITAVIFHEPTYREYTAQGLMTMYSGAQIKDFLASGYMKCGEMTKPYDEIKSQENIFICKNNDIYEKTLSNLTAKTNAKTKALDLTNADGEKLLAIATESPLTELARIGLGYPTEQMDELTNISVIPQIRSWYELGGFDEETEIYNKFEQALDVTFKSLEQYRNILAIGFTDKFLPGYYGSENKYKAVKEQLSQRLITIKKPIMSIEFYNQVGLDGMAQELNYNVLREHTVLDGELDAMSGGTMADRYKLATSERNMRIAYFKINSKLTFKENLHNMDAVYSAITSTGLSIGVPNPLDTSEIKTWQYMLMITGIMAAFALLLKELNLKKWSYIFAALGLIGSAGLLFIGQIGLMQKGLSLAAVMLFPILSVQRLVSSKPRSFFKATLTLLAMTAMSLTGAIYSSGLLSVRGYMVNIEMFRGVKLSLILPLIILALIFFYRSYKERDGKFNITKIAKEIYATKVTIGLAVLAAVALYGAMTLLLRSGNDAPTISSFELLFRGFMYDLMSIRPRTKEFMIGYPLMMVVLYFGNKKYMWILAVAAAIGQVSAVNTFNHIFTPFTTSIIRTVNGLVSGIVIGVAAILVIKLAIKLSNKYFGTSIMLGENKKT